MKEQFLISAEIERNKVSNTDIYPFNLPSLQGLGKIAFHKNVTFIIGENGTGKSTLIEAIAIAYGFNPEGGSKNFHFSTQKSHSELEKYIRIAQGITKPKDGYFLRAESYYNLASNIDILDNEESFGPPIKDSYGGVSLHEQSHGESFFSLFQHRLSGKGVYIFDEPESALSPQRQLAFLVRLHELVQKSSQFIIATHSPIILSYPHAKILELTQEGCHEVSYKESAHYQLYNTFMNSPEHMIHKLGINN